MLFTYISLHLLGPLWVQARGCGAAGHYHDVSIVQGDRVSNFLEALKLLPAHGIEVRLHHAIGALLAAVFRSARPNEIMTELWGC